MRRPLDLAHAAFRWAYYLSMYSGLRAVVNRAQGRMRALGPRVARLDGARIVSDELGELVVRVHARARPLAPGAPGDHGVLSLRQPAPRVGRWTYRYLCATSHFGCGHVELAFFERAGEVTFYGIRNIARANAHRLGLAALSTRLRLADSDEDARVLAAVTSLLSASGIAVRHAEPHDCVRLTLDDRLLAPGRAATVRNSLRRKYARLRGTVRADPS